MHKLGVRVRAAVGESAHVQQGCAAEHQGGRGQVTPKGTAGLARSNGSRGRRQRRRQDLRSAEHKSSHGGRQPIPMTDRADFLNGHEFGPQLRQQLVQGREQTSRGGIAMNDDIPVAGELRDQRRTAPAIVDEMNDGDRPVLLQALRIACSVGGAESAQQMTTSQPQRLEGSTWQGARASSTNSLRCVASSTEQPGARPARRDRRRGGTAAKPQPDWRSTATAGRWRGTPGRRRARRGKGSTRAGRSRLAASRTPRPRPTPCGGSSGGTGRCSATFASSPAYRSGAISPEHITSIGVRRHDRDVECDGLAVVRINSPSNRPACTGGAPGV